jgi:hypothetical protein
LTRGYDLTGGAPLPLFIKTHPRRAATDYSGDMTTVWILVLLGAGAFAVVLFLWSRHGIDMTELGTVSQNWLSEQRANDRHYSER